MGISETVISFLANKEQGIYFHELSKFYVDFFDICDEIIFNGNKTNKDYVTNVLYELEQNKSISWDQFNKVLKIYNQ